MISYRIVLMLGNIIEKKKLENFATKLSKKKKQIEDKLEIFKV